MADAEEIEEAVHAAREVGCTNLAILRCVSGYPAPAEDYNLRTIPDMFSKYDAVVGLSDHTLDNTTAIASIALGHLSLKSISHLIETVEARMIVFLSSQRSSSICVMHQRLHGVR